jgi:RNA polymerase primary sigma factor
MICVGSRHVSLDAPFADGRGSLHDSLSTGGDGDDAERAVMHMSLRREVGRSMECLSEREQGILALYFGIGCDTGHTLDEIGQHFNLTRERIRQIKAKALGKLRRSQHNQRLRSLSEEQ